MTIQTNLHAAPTARADLLRTVLRADGLSCIASGILALVAARPLAAWTGIGSATALMITGAVLAAYGGFLFIRSASTPASRRLGIAAVIVNVLWVLDSVVLLASGALPLTNAGFWLIAGLAIVVALFADLQLFALWRMRKQDL